MTRSQLEAWSALYGIQHRQIRRLIARGREKGEPCPLDDPARMPAWVEKHVDKIRADLWAKVNAAAEAAKAPPIPGGGAAGRVAGATEIAKAAAPVGMSIDLATVGGVEGESVDLFRRLFAAAKVELEDAYKSGTEERKRTLHARLEKLGESLRKHEAAAEAKAKRRGELLSRAEVFTAISEALGVLRLMRAQRIKRVLGRLPSLPLELVGEITAALEESASREEDVLANLSIVQTPDDLLLRLAA